MLQEFYLILSAIIFTIGTVGVLTRSNAIVIFMSIELMLNAVNLSIITFASFSNDPVGQVFVFFVMAVAAAEAAIGLAIVIALYRLKKTMFIDNLKLLRN
ncbi:MAG: NADH-quinone oxidoreductase subunit NuoK [Ignavibacteria bacterium]|jgi:NADH-quinone oxidoreductase subunit K|nr:NADH-quinone oxidoreductase subunit NuoK [Ignavibacteria bacterium]